MSRIGKLPIPVPSGVEVSLDQRAVTVKGPKGTRSHTVAAPITVDRNDNCEIAVVRPKVIVVLGNTACQNLLETKVGITKLRGEFQDYYGIKVMPTFHPAYLLRDPSKKRETWEDMKKVRDYLNSLE